MLLKGAVLVDITNTMACRFVGTVFQKFIHVYSCVSVETIVDYNYSCLN